MELHVVGLLLLQLKVLQIVMMVQIRRMVLMLVVGQSSSCRRTHIP